MLKNESMEREIDHITKLDKLGKEEKPSRKIYWKILNEKIPSLK